MKSLARFLSFTLLALLAFPPFATANAPVPDEAKVAKVVYQPTALTWRPQITYRSVNLRVVGPGGFVHDQDFGSGLPVFDLVVQPRMVDGQYTFELVFGLQPNAVLAKALSSTVRDEGGTISDPVLGAQINALRETFSGTFRIEGGQLVSPFLVELPAPGGSAMKGAQDPLPFGQKQITQADNVAVQGSLCVGLDCTTAEAFGFDTIRLKENNTRIKFEDTSAAGFPTTDWQLTANDSASGGANKFSIEDITSATIPFTVIGAAPTNSLFIASSGKVGLRTATPVLDLHALTGNTPAIRLEQDASGGFTAQTWDIAGNEANFFIRDVTGGSRLPFRIRPGAPTSSFDISSAGSVGIGTASPNLGGVVRALTVSAGSSFSALELQGNQTVDGATGVVRFYNGSNLNAQIAGVRDSADNSASLRFLTANAGTISEKMRITPTGRVGIGTMSPTSTLHVQGDATVTGALHVSGACCGPDYVFDSTYQLASIEEQAEYMWKNRHLPAVGAARTTPDGAALVDVFAQSNGMLEEIEKAHIYIEKLHREIKALKAEASARDAQIRAELVALRKRIEN